MSEKPSRGGRRVSRREHQAAKRPSRRQFRRRLFRWVYLSTIGVVGFLIIVSLILPQLPLGNRTGGAQIGDHWHASLQLEVCGSPIILPPSQGGIHSHNDDMLIHVHPSHTGETSGNANLARFFASLKMTISADQIQPPGEDLYVNGQACPDGSLGTVQVLINEQEATETFLTHVIKDNDQVEIYFR